MSLLARMFGRSASKPVAWMEPDELAALLSEAAPPLVIDVRGPGEFTGPLGHIEGARNIPLDQIEFQAAALLGEQKHLVMVCHTDRRSSAAADHLQRMGAEEIAVLRGGMVAWRSLRN